MTPDSRLRYGKTCDRCGTAITVAPGETALCDRHRRDEALARTDQRR